MQLIFFYYSIITKWNFLFSLLLVQFTLIPYFFLDLNNKILILRRVVFSFLIIFLSIGKILSILMYHIYRKNEYPFYINNNISITLLNIYIIAIDVLVCIPIFIFLSII